MARVPRLAGSRRWLTTVSGLLTIVLSAQPLRHLGDVGGDARASSQASGLLVTHQPQELGFVNVAVFDEAGD